MKPELLMRRLGYLLVAVLFVSGLTGLPRVQQDSEILALLPAEHPERLRYEAWRTQFNQTDALVAVISTASGTSVLEPEALRLIATVSQTLAGVPGIDTTRISSLSEQIRPTFSDGDLRIEKLAPPTSPDPASATEASLRAMPVFDGLLVAHDRAAALVMAPLKPGESGTSAYPAAQRALSALSVPPDLQVELAGDAAVTGYLSRYIERDAFVLTPIAVVISLLLMAGWLRHPAALIPGASVILGTLLITLGLMGWAGCRIYVITSSLPAILVCVSVADCIHLGHGVRRRIGEGMGDRAVLAGLRDQLRPMGLTSITTAAGFLGIAVGSSNAPMREFGLFAALGTLVAFLLTVLIVPAMMRRYPATIGRSRALRVHQVAVSRARDWVTGRPGLVVAAVMALAGCAAVGIPQLTLNEERIRNFASDSAIRVADERLNQGFSGSRSLDLGLVASQPGALLQPQVIERVRQLQTDLDARGLMRGAHSYVDLIDAMRLAAAEGDDAHALTSADEAEQWLFMYELQGEHQTVDDRLSSDRDRAIIRGYRTSDNYTDLRSVVAEIRGLAAEHLTGTGVKVEVTGPAYLIIPLFEPVAPSMLMGASLALALVALSAMLALRSSAHGLVSAVPVLLSVFAIFGIMGWTGVWMDVASSMVASITIGLGVDFAIYVQLAAIEGRRAGLRGSLLSAHVYNRVGTPLAANAVILAVGFSVTVLSAIPPVRNFGLLVSSSIIVAAVSSLLLLPALHALLRTADSPREATQHLQKEGAAS